MLKNKLNLMIFTLRINNFKEKPYQIDAIGTSN